MQVFSELFNCLFALFIEPINELGLSVELVSCSNVRMEFRGLAPKLIHKHAYISAEKKLMFPCLRCEHKELIEINSCSPNNCSNKPHCGIENCQPFVEEG